MNPVNQRDPISSQNPIPIRPEAISAGNPRRARDVGRPEDGAPAFRALLDRLEERARELAREVGRVEDGPSLSGALDRARDSVGDAHEVRERLLEAYRQAQRQGDEFRTRREFVASLPDDGREPRGAVIATPVDTVEHRDGDPIERRDDENTRREAHARLANARLSQDERAP